LTELLAAAGELREVCSRSTGKIPCRFSKGDFCIGLVGLAAAGELREDWPDLAGLLAAADEPREDWSRSTAKFLAAFVRVIFVEDW